MKGQKMFKQITPLLLMVCCVIGFHTAWSEESEKPVPVSLDDAKTFEEIQAYIEHVFAESQKDLKTKEDQERFYETYPPIGIAGAQKIIALNGDDESMEYGYGVLLAALDWSSRIYPSAIKDFEAIYEELKKNGKFPELVNNARCTRFYQQWRLFKEKIPKHEWSTIKDEFNALKEESKELMGLEKINHPPEIVLDLAREISLAQKNPRFLEEVLEELVRFVTDAQYGKLNEAFLRGYCRRMVDAPFELWGKTVDGKDFHWTDYKGKIVLIDFTALGCGPCREEMPNIVELYNKFHDQGLEVVCVGSFDTTDNLKQMIEEDKITFPMISEELSEGDSRGIPTEYYAVHAIPTIFLVGKEGRIIADELRGPVLRDTGEKQFAGKEETTTP
jgi:peroxiredoxin